MALVNFPTTLTGYIAIDTETGEVVSQRLTSDDLANWDDALIESDNWRPATPDEVDAAKRVYYDEDPEGVTEWPGWEWV